MDKSNLQSPDYLSRSAMAESLDIPLKDLTQLLVDSGWIIQEGKQWRLTAKGEFEGGIYRESKKYGQYIVWPVSIIDHPMIREIQEEQVTVTTLAKQMHLPARLFNKILFELSWIKPFTKGWQLTSFGQLYKGRQAQNNETGVPYVTWPRDLLENIALKKSLSSFGEEPSLQTLNGVKTLNREHSIIGSWLYIVGLSYSYQRELLLPQELSITPDFYLPATMVCIDCWGLSLSPKELSLQLAKREMYKKYKINAIEIDVKNINDVDQELSRELMQLGITVY